MLTPWSDGSRSLQGTKPCDLSVKHFFGAMRNVRMIRHSPFLLPQFTHTNPVRFKYVLGIEIESFVAVVLWGGMKDFGDGETARPCSPRCGR